MSLKHESSDGKCEELFAIPAGIARPEVQRSSNARMLSADQHCRLLTAA